MSNRYLGFPLPEALAEKIRQTLDTVRAATDKRKHALDLYNLIVELSDTGLEYYFIQPLKKAKIGSFTIKATEMAMNLGKSGVLKVGKSVLRSMDNDQLMVVVELIENSFIEPAKPAENE